MKLYYNIKNFYIWAINMSQNLTNNQILLKELLNKNLQIVQDIKILIVNLNILGSVHYGLKKFGNLKKLIS